LAPALRPAVESDSLGDHEPQRRDRDRMPQRADRRFYLLAAISLLLVLLIAADGMRKGLDTIVPDYYRHTASLAIAISETAHGTSGMVGLTEVANALDKSGYGINSNRNCLPSSIPIRTKPMRLCAPPPILRLQTAARRSVSFSTKPG